MKHEISELPETQRVGRVLVRACLCTGCGWSGWMSSRAMKGPPPCASAVLDAVKRVVPPEFIPCVVKL